MELTSLKLNCDYLNLDDEFYQRLSPSPLKKAGLIDYSSSAAQLIGLNPQKIDAEHLCKLINGERLFEGSQPYAMCYAGHQFGFYSPRLGDGRVLNLGENRGWHLQLKGSGPTLYSRNGDGRAVFRSSIREYLMSEAMFHLGVPTSRALGIIKSEQEVQRERIEKGAIVLRLSPSWIRFGHFEYFFYKKKYTKLKALLDYTLQASFPHLQSKKDAYLLFFKEVVASTAKLIASWQALGFNHGVMNTDNMSIMGLGIDYGPFAFMNKYQSDYICNHSDTEGRYAFANQPYIAQWNLSKLMHALSPLINEEAMQEALNKFRELYTQHYTRLMLDKLGLEEVYKEDRLFIRSTLKMLQANQTDYTGFFRTLSHYQEDSSIFTNLAINHSDLKKWLPTYKKRLLQQDILASDRNKKMLKTNPKYILKNHLIQEAIEGLERGENEVFEILKTLLQAPYDENQGYDSYARSTQDALANLQLSCSS